MKLHRDIPCFMCKVIMSFPRQSFTDMGIIQQFSKSFKVGYLGLQVGGGRESLPNAKLILHVSTRHHEGYKGPPHVTVGNPDRLSLLSLLCFMCQEAAICNHELGWVATSLFIDCVSRTLINAESRIVLTHCVRYCKLPPNIRSLLLP